MTTTQDEAAATDIPDLRDMPLSRLASAPSGLVEAIALIRERAEKEGVPPRGFNSSL